tara:strand:- start:104 stop:1330 length:1227 start_codon:yes stop_codon:yes gene_type:complete
MSGERQVFFDAFKKDYGDIDVVSRLQVDEVAAKLGIKAPSWLINYRENRAGRGLYSLSAAKEFWEQKDAGTTPRAERVARPKVVPPKAPIASVVPSSNVTVTDASDAPAMTGTYDNSEEPNLVPERAEGYVPFGNFNDIRAVIRSIQFYPAFVTGLSGNGKTMMIEQVCAALGRECIRVNITIETDEDDLIGGFRLINGHTVWQNGPVVIAMERGAILLLDEVDLGSNKLMCLQPVLEGRPIFLKKINKMIYPKDGFNIFATANTKGKGSEDGRFIGTNVLNEAFLERFSITVEQEYPNVSIEKKILTNDLAKLGLENAEFVSDLVDWANATREAFYQGILQDLISTRRLVSIIKAYQIFGQNEMKAIGMCLNRFDEDTKRSLLDYYTKRTDRDLSAPAETDDVEEAA